MPRPPPSWSSSSSALAGASTGDGSGTDAELALTDDRVDAGDVALDGAQAAVALELTGGRLEAQVEQLFLGLLQLVDETLVFKGVELDGASSLDPTAIMRRPPRA